MSNKWKSRDSSPVNLDLVDPEKVVQDNHGGGEIQLMQSLKVRARRRLHRPGAVPCDGTSVAPRLNGDDVINCLVVGLAMACLSQRLDGRLEKASSKPWLVSALNWSLKKLSQSA